MSRRKRDTTIERPPRPGPGHNGQPGDRQFVTALARGLDVLRAFRPGEAMLGNQEIAERTGLSKPTISRLTHTLLELGYLTYSARSGRYQLGPGVLALGYATIAGLEVRPANEGGGAQAILEPGHLQPLTNVGCPWPLASAIGSASSISIAAGEHKRSRSA